MLADRHEYDSCVYIKICGLRDGAMTEHAVLAGADAVGVVMSEGSPRNATPEEARAVIQAARRADRAVDTVLVVRHHDAVAAAELAQTLGFDVLQFHGRYTESDFRAAAQIHPRLWRATSLAEHPDLTEGEYGEERLLVDGSTPGSGEPWDLELIRGAKLGVHWLLAGGLSPETVAQAVREARPAGVDVSSGVESAPGVKDPEAISRFISAAREA